MRPETGRESIEGEKEGTEEQRAPVSTEEERAEVPSGSPPPAEVTAPVQAPTVPVRVVSPSIPSPEN